MADDSKLDFVENATSMLALTQDIQRWLLAVSIKGSISTDRRTDMVRAAKRLEALALKL